MIVLELLFPCFVLICVVYYYSDYSFVDALLTIRREIADVAAGRISAEDSPLRHAPHTAAVLTSDQWDRKYSRAQAAYPAPWVRILCFFCSFLTKILFSIF
jgi:hypothetical protein